MDVEIIKFVVITYGDTIEYKGENYQVILEKLTTTSLKNAKRIAKRLKQNYPERKAVIKEKFRGGWKVIASL